MRVVGVCLVVLAFGLTVYSISTFLRDLGKDKGQDEKASKVEDQEKPFPPTMRSSATDSQMAAHPVPVTLNRGADVREGFHGDIHPLLFGQTQLEVTANWTSIGKGRDALDRSVIPLVYSWFTDLRPAEARKTYTARDFSAFLPAEVGEVGQVWELDSNKMADVLKQFHPHPSMRLIATGRRAGPDGAFAILRAVSDSYLDVAFRIHAEFFLTPGEGEPGTAPINAWYSPSYFEGNMLVNKKNGTVDYFRLALANDKSLNVHLTVQAIGMIAKEAHDIVRVERMELAGGRMPEDLRWAKEMTPAAASAKLAKIFYKSLEIDFVPCNQALALARSRGKPIFAIVSWGSFDDQSC
jgi:hypothetical protein